MIQVEVSTRIQRPVDAVFAILADIDRLPEWVGSVVASEKTSSGPVAVGTTIRQDLKIVGRRQEGWVEVTNYDPPHRLEQRFTTGPVHGTMRYSLTALDGATKVLQEVEAEFGGSLRPPDSIVASVMKSEFQADLDRLKLLIEKEMPRATGSG
jgi:uncharacterized protein YndB with AHSA1/START domain